LGTLGPFLTAGGLEKLGYGSDEILVHGKRNLVRTNEHGDQVVVVVSRLVSYNASINGPLEKPTIGASSSVLEPPRHQPLACAFGMPYQG